MTEPIVRYGVSNQLRAVLFNFYQSDYGPYQQIFYGSAESIFSDIEETFPQYVAVLLSEHFEEIESDGSLSKYFREHHGLGHDVIHVENMPELMKLLEITMIKCRHVLKPFTNGSSILNSEWYGITKLFEGLEGNNHLSIDYEESLPYFCKNFYNNKISHFDFLETPNPDYSQIGRLAVLASFEEREWNKRNVKDLFRDYVKSFNDRDK